MASAPADDSTKSDAFRQMGANLVQLMMLHLRLARLEFQEKFLRLGKPLAFGLLCLPAVLIAAVFISLAGALLLTKWLPLWASLGVVGLLYGLTALSVLGFLFMKLRQLVQESSHDR